MFSRTTASTSRSSSSAGRHVEIQLLADKYGNVVHLGARDCTVQRNHQKLVEESPAPSLDADERRRTLDAAVKACRDIGYVGAGTMEFLLDSSGTLRFMEMNTRLQVEHCVSEMRSGIDLVAEQLRVAAGQRLSFTQDDIVLRGHAIECRINAEDPTKGFQPAPGVIDVFEVPAMDGVRVDNTRASGYEVPPFYDSLICKVIAYGDDREAARERMLEALAALRCEGVPTTTAMHRAILASEAFATSKYDTSFIPGWPQEERTSASPQGIWGIDAAPRRRSRPADGLNMRCMSAHHRDRPGRRSINLNRSSSPW